jgi:hypothetical protein
MSGGAVCQTRPEDLEGRRPVKAATTAAHIIKKPAGGRI